MSAYMVPSEPSNAQYEVKRSRFLTEIRPITSMAQMKEFIREKRELHPKANHNCWAVIYGAPSDSNSYGFSDDGEPNGCAGKPMFTILQYSGTGHIGMVVTRYFGGIKLGTGGMVKAYTEAAKAGLEATDLIDYSPMKTLKVMLPYSQEPHLRYLMEQAGLNSAEFHYDHAVTAITPIREDEVETVHFLLKENLGNDVGITVS